MARTLIGLFLFAATVATTPAAAQMDIRIDKIDEFDRDLSPLRGITLRKAISLEQSSTLPETQMFAPGGEPLPIYLNPWGDTYYGGFDDSSTNQSSIVSIYMGNGAAATISPFSGTSDDWTTVLSCVQGMFSRFNVYVTDVEPLEGDYVEASVGGTIEDMNGQRGTLGVAPYDPDCQSMTKAVVFAFSEDTYYLPRTEQSMQSLCETITQEVAHAFSLDHEFMCEDPMTYLDGCGAKEFQDVYAPCGEGYERECSCSGDTQNSVQMLWEILGPGEGITPPPPPNDVEPPTLALLSPTSETTVQSNTTLDIVATATDDIGLVTVTLEWEDSGLPCPGEGQGWRCFVEGDTYTWSIDVGVGLRQFSLRARDVMGKVAQTDTHWLWLSDDLDQVRPDDETPPELTLVYPAPDTIVPLEQDTEFIITAYDEHTAIQEVGLVRLFGNGGGFVIPCIEDDGSDEDQGFFSVSCTKLGGTYIFKMGNRREGTRGWAAIATDLLGNETIADTRYYSAISGADPRPAGDMFEPNDTWDLAQKVACGTSLDLNVDTADSDWFEVNVPAGMLVNVSVTGEVADQLRLSAHDGPLASNVLEHVPAKQGFEVTAPEQLRFRVHSNGTVAGNYTVKTICSTQDLFEPTATPKFLGVCNHTDVDGGPSALFGAFALLGLALLARRRR